MDNYNSIYTVNHGIEQYTMTVTKDEFMQVYKLSAKERYNSISIVSLVCFISSLLAIPFNSLAVAIIASFGFIYILLLLISLHSVKSQWVKKSQTIESRQFLVDIFEDKISVSTIENGELINRYSMNYDNVVFKKENEQFILFVDNIQLFYVKKSILPEDSILIDILNKSDAKYKKISIVNNINIILYMVTAVLSLFIYSCIDSIATYLGNPSCWLYFLVLPFSAGLIILSLILKKYNLKWKPSLIFGIVFSLFCIINGLGQVGYNKYYDSGYNVIYETENQIGIEIPVPDNIKFYKDSYTESNRIEIINDVNMEFSEQEYVQTDINYVEKIISYDVWVKGLPENYKDIIPHPDYFADSEYSILYNVDTKEINTVPSERGTHRLVLIAYYYGTLDIVEYTINT